MRAEDREGIRYYMYGSVVSKRSPASLHWYLTRTRFLKIFSSSLFSFSISNDPPVGAGGQSRNSNAQASSTVESRLEQSSF